METKNVDHMEAESRPVVARAGGSGVNGETLVKEYTVSVMQDK